MNNIHDTKALELSHEVMAYFYPGDESECKSVSLPEELDDEQKANCIPLVTIHKASDGWISVSERMPEPGRWLALYGAPVFTHGPKAGEPWCEFSVDQGYLDKEDGKFYLLNWDRPGQIGDSYNNDLAIATHWMYWELPDAPKGV